MFSTLISKLRRRKHEAFTIDLTTTREAIITVLHPKGRLEIKVSRDEREYIYVTETERGHQVYCEECRAWFDSPPLIPEVHEKHYGHHIRRSE